MSSLWIKWTLISYLSYAKTFYGLIQCIIGQKGKKIESRTTTLKEASVKANNALIVYNFNPPINIENLNVSKDIGHLIGDGIIGRDN